MRLPVESLVVCLVAFQEEEQGQLAAGLIVDHIAAHIVGPLCLLGLVIVVDVLLLPVDSAEDDLLAEADLHFLVKDEVVVAVEVDRHLLR